MKIYTTFRLLREHGACKERYKKLAKKLGGIKNYGKDRPISFLNILKHNGIDDTLWALGTTPPEQNEIRDKFARVLAKRYVLEVAHLWNPLTKVFREVYKELNSNAT